MSVYRHICATPVIALIVLRLLKEFCISLGVSEASGCEDSRSSGTCIGVRNPKRERGLGASLTFRVEKCIAGTDVTGCSFVSRFGFSAGTKFAIVALLCVFSSGCGESGIGPIHSVRGRIVRDAEPIKVVSGYVVLKPDAERGNQTKFEPSGTIDADGSFAIFTEKHDGDPPGWYKVVVTASGEQVRPSAGESSTRPTAKSLVPPEYGREESTPLAIEVVASPEAGAYDLNIAE